MVDYLRLSTLASILIYLFSVSILSASDRDLPAVLVADEITVTRDRVIVASGNVEVDSPQYTAKTDRLEYDVKAQILELSGKDSKITMGKNSIAGSKITYYRAEERFKVEGGTDKRVNAVFFSDGTVSDMLGNEGSDEESKE